LGERRARVVVLLSLATLVVELVAGWLTGSMALVADGWHMATHVGAVGLAWLAYHYGRHGDRLGRFAFGPAKVNALAGYTNALLLGGAALLLAGESLHRLREAHPIRFGEALPVAVLGLLVNVVAALLLGRPKDGHHDHNLRAVYLHVLADAMTSVLAIGALLGGSLAGWRGLDPAAGLIGAAVILVWAVGLARRTAGELMDMTGEASTLRARVIARLESEGDLRIEEIRIWPLGGGVHGCTVRAVSHASRSAAELKEQILAVCTFGHLSVEVHAADTNAAAFVRSRSAAS
jgi:cation diffusion facilitator family transporter